VSEGLAHLLQLVVSGVVTGGIYALAAMGFVVVYKATHVINFATGELMMLGAFFAWTAMTALQAPFVAALAVAVVAAAVLGTATERLVLRPLLGQRPISVIMVTIGLAAVFKGLAQIAWSGEYRSFPSIFPRAPIELGPLILPSRQFYPFLIALAAIALVGLGFRFTRTGTAMRATADDQMAAFGMGIDIRRVFSLSWSIAAVTAAVAGIVVGIIGGISPQLGAIGLRMFPVVILGGLDSIGGALVGGVIIGVLENLAGGYVDPHMGGSSLKEVIPFVVLVMVLMIRPYGLFGTREVERL
jgi:branched-chain amino acid transport system permease protein